MTKSFLWGRFAVLPELDAGAAERLCREARRRREKAASRGTWKTLRALGEAGKLWAAPSSPFRRKAQRIMPRISGFSPAMVSKTLDIIPRLLDPAALRRRLEAELGREDALDAWSLDPDGAGAVKAFPLGGVLHVAAGNIFLGCIDSVVMSLLTRNVTVLRLSAADREFPLLFAQSLLRADPEGELTSSLAILSWESGRKDVEAVFKKRLQGVVVWGGEEAVAAYRDGLGVGCKLVAFGPKLSFGVLSREGLRRHGAREAARRAAQDVAWWDQLACASPQTLFVQGPRPDAFLKRLSAELERLGKEAGRLEPDEAASAVEAKHRALASELQGRGLLSAGPRWTLAWNPEAKLRSSPLHRFLHVCPYRDLRHLRSLIEPAAPYLQSAGLLLGAVEEPAYAEALAQAGLARTPGLGRMLESETGEPHDGRYPLRELVRWTAGPGEAACGGSEAALAGLLEQAAAESPFYRKRLKGRGAKSLSGALLLGKEDLRENSPPRSEAILTRAGVGRGKVLFASGGSTGKPKFCLYTQQEFERTCRWLAWGLRRAGLEPGDVVANLFVAGNLWSSFMAIEGAARALAVTHMPIGGTSEPALVLDTLRRFKANVLIGLPSTLLELARRAEAEKSRGLAVEKIFYGGEHVSKEMELYWRRVFGARRVRSAGYASVDAGFIGFQCARCEGTVHHAAQGSQFVEIVASSGRPARPGEAGEIVATNLIRRWMPVIRYRTGDLGRWLPGVCPCGHPAPRFALLGRCDDRVNVGGAHLDVGDVGRAVAAVPGLSLSYQVEVGGARGGERLLVRVERKPGARARNGLERRLGEALLKSSHELRDSVARGWLAAPEVELLAPGGLPRQPRTGKIRRVVDLRTAG